MLDDDAPTPLYDGYDGRLRLAWPDDLYVIGSAEALVGLRRAIDRALTRGQAACTGLASDGMGRLVIVTCVEPRPGKLAEELEGKPRVVPEPAPARIVTLFDRRLATEEEGL